MSDYNIKSARDYKDVQIKLNKMQAGFIYLKSLRIISKSHNIP